MILVDKDIKRYVEQQQLILSGYTEDNLNGISYDLTVDTVLDTTGIEPMSHVFPVQNVFREDIVTNKDESEKTLRNAPGQKDNMFMVPRTFE